MSAEPAVALLTQIVAAYKIFLDAQIAYGDRRPDVVNAAQGALGDRIAEARRLLGVKPRR